MVSITRYVNFPNLPLPNNSVNYTSYNDATANANDGDTIIIYVGEIIVTEFIYNIEKPKEVNHLNSLNSDSVVKVLYSIIESDNANINSVKNINNLK